MHTTEPTLAAYPAELVDRLTEYLERSAGPRARDAALAFLRDVDELIAVDAVVAYADGTPAELELEETDAAEAAAAYVIAVGAELGTYTALASLSTPAGAAALNRRLELAQRLAARYGLRRPWADDAWSHHVAELAATIAGHEAARPVDTAELQDAEYELVARASGGAYWRPKTEERG